VIATAAYGSELAPQVQELRTFRDDIVFKTFAGSSFMRAFNAFYYSWSPPVAEFISDKPALRSAVRASLVPLLRSLSLSKGLVEVLGGPSEFSIVVAGLLPAALIGAAYLAIPEYALLRAARLRVGRSWLKVFGTAWTASVVALTVGTLLKV